MPIPTTDGDEMRLEVNAQTGKLRPVWASGDVAFDDAMTETVMSLLVEDEGPFTTGRRRGPGPFSVAIDTADALSQIKARAAERLQLAVDDGRLREFTVEAERAQPGKRGRFVVFVEYTTRAGRQNSLAVPIG